MSRVGFCVTAFMLLLAYTPAALCLELPQQRLGERHIIPANAIFGRLPNTHEFNDFEHRERFEHPGEFQHPAGFEQRKRFNRPGLNHFERQQNEQINQQHFGQINFQEGNNDQDILHRTELKGLKKSKSILNYPLEHREEDILQGLQPGLQRIEHFEHKKEDLLRSNGLKALEQSQGLDNFKLTQRQGGLLGTNFGLEGNAEGLLKSNELKKSQGLLNLEHGEQTQELLDRPKSNEIRQFELGLGHKTKGLVQTSELNGLENIQGQNLEFKHQQNSLLKRRKSKNLSGFEQIVSGQDNKQAELLKSFELNGLKNSQGVHNYEIGQQQGHLLQEIQTELKNINLGRKAKKGILHKNQINTLNNVRRLQNLDLREQQKNQFENFNTDKFKLIQNVNLPQKNQGPLQPNEFNVLKNHQRQNNILEGVQFNGVQQIQELGKKQRQLLSQELNGHPNQHIFTQPFQRNQQNVQAINRFAQPSGVQQTFSYNRPTYPHHFYFNGNRPDKATVQKMIEEARILAQNLRRIHQNYKHPVPLPVAPVQSFDFAHQNIPNNAESFSVNVQPVSQSNGQSIVKIGQTRSESLKAELDKADKLLLDDLARRGFRINEVTHKLEKIPKVVQATHLPIIQTAPIEQPAVLKAITSAEGALEKSVSQISTSAQAVTSIGSSSQVNLPPVLPSLNIADLSSTLDRSDQISINLGTNSAENVPGQVLSHTISSSSQGPSSAGSLTVTSSSTLSDQSEQGNINGISTTSLSTNKQLNPIEVTVESTTLPSALDLVNPAISESMSNIIANPSSQISTNTASTSFSSNGISKTSSSTIDQSVPISIIGSSITAPHIIDLPNQVVISSISPSERISVSSSTLHGQGKSSQEIINTTSSPTKGPQLVSASTSSTGGQGEELSINGITTTSLPGDLPSLVITNSQSISGGNPISANTVSASSSSSNGQSGSVAINGITTILSEHNYPEAASITIESSASHDQNLPSQITLDTIPAFASSPISVNAGSSTSSVQSETVAIDEITTTPSKENQSGKASVTIGSTIIPSNDIPSQIIMNTTPSSSGNSFSVSTSSTPSGGQSGSVAINGITTSSKENQSGTASINIGSSNSPSSDIPSQIIINTTPPSAESSISISTSSSPSDGKSGSVVTNGITTTASKENQSGTASITIGSSNSPSSDISSHIIIDTIPPSTDSSISISTSSSSSGGQSGSVAINGIAPTLSEENHPESTPIALGSSTSLSGRDSKNTSGKLTIESTSPSMISPVSIHSVSMSSSTSLPESGSVAITTVNKGKTKTDGQAEIIPASSRPLPGFESELNSHNIVKISDTSFGTSPMGQILSDIQDSVQNKIHISKQHSTKSKPSDIPIDFAKRIFKRLDPGAHQKRKMSQLVVAPKNSDKLFQMILHFNSTLDKYMKLYGNETNGINVKHKSILELPWDKEHLGPAAFINRYLNEEWQTNVTKAIEELGKISNGSKYRKHNSRVNHPKKGFMIDGTSLTPIDDTEISSDLYNDRHFKWTGTVYAKSCHGDCNAEPACGFTCGRTCVDYKEPSRFCNRHEKCNIGACQCKPGFVLDLNTNRCVDPEQCSQCGPNEYLDECPDLCVPEDCPSNRPHQSCHSNDDCPKPICRCIMNYRRNKDDICVPIQQCPKTSHCRQTVVALGSFGGVGDRVVDDTPIIECISSENVLKQTGPEGLSKLECYGLNEIYSPCTRDDLDESCASGLAHCFTSKVQNQSPIMCIPRCTCAPGHLRNRDNECVPIDECSNTSHKQEYIEESVEEEVIEI